MCACVHVCTCMHVCRCSPLRFSAGGLAAADFAEEEEEGEGWGEAELLIDDG